MRRDSLPLLLMVTVLLLAAQSVTAQDTVTGAFEGIVSDSQTGAALKGALVEITNQQTGVAFNLRTRAGLFAALRHVGARVARRVLRIRRKLAGA